MTWAVLPRASGPPWSTGEKGRIFLTTADRRTRWGREGPAKEHEGKYEVSAAEKCHVLGSTRLFDGRDQGFGGSIRFADVIEARRNSTEHLREPEEHLRSCAEYLRSCTARLRRRSEQSRRRTEQFRSGQGRCGAVQTSCGAVPSNCGVVASTCEREVASAGLALCGDYWS